jgi:hypothetical protein
VSGADTGRTTHYAAFAGQRRRFRLRLGEMAELERLCGAGIGAIMVRLHSHQFKAADIRETVRLGLEGGGMIEPEATALVMHYLDDGVPLADHIALAGEILNACVCGVPDTGKPEGERSDDPATSPPSTLPAPRSASRRKRSTG